jgi:hypothetical protein
MHALGFGKNSLFIAICRFFLLATRLAVSNQDKFVLLAHFLSSCLLLGTLRTPSRSPRMSVLGRISPLGQRRRSAICGHPSSA